MKARIIKGISRLPVRRVGLMTKHLGEADLGLMPFCCSMCGKVTYLKPFLAAIICPECQNCRLELSEHDYLKARSATRIENWTTHLVFKVGIQTIIDWCKDNIKNYQWRGYLNLDRGYLQPRINHERVPTRVYYNVIRFIMFNIVATNARHLRFLAHNNVDITGVDFLGTSPGFDVIARNLGDYHSEGNRGGFAGDRPGGAYDRRALTIADIRDVLRVYGIDPDGVDRDIFE